MANSPPLQSGRRPRHGGVAPLLLAAVTRRSRSVGCALPALNSRPTAAPALCCGARQTVHLLQRPRHPPSTGKQRVSILAQVERFAIVDLSHFPSKSKASKRRYVPGYAGNRGKDSTGGSSERVTGHVKDPAVAADTAIGGAPPRTQSGILDGRGRGNRLTRTHSNRGQASRRIQGPGRTCESIQRTSTERTNRRDQERPRTRRRTTPSNRRGYNAPRRSLNPPDL